MTTEKRIKLWLELKTTTVRQLDRLAKVQGRSRANLLARIVQVAIEHPDSQRGIAGTK